MEFLGNLKNTVAHALHLQTTPAPAITKTEIVDLEESERSRRIVQSSQSNIDMQNAANLSTIIKSQNFPVMSGVSKGYKRVTIKFEEEERRRRLTNKSESALRRGNANKTARMIQHMGWPLFQQTFKGTEYIVMDPTRLLEEEERDWRTSEAFWRITARHNAAMLANIMRWENFQRNTNVGFVHHVRRMEERERCFRLLPDIMNQEMQNAYNTATLVKKMGAPFYVQTVQLAKPDFSKTNKLEEDERIRRMLNPEGAQLAHEVAGIVDQKFNPTSKDAALLEEGLSHKSFSSDKAVEEQERGRRILDIRAQKQAMANAKSVSLMVRESSSNNISGTAPMWFSISRNTMNALAEIERERRLRDVEGQGFAMAQAKMIANIIANKSTTPIRPDFHSIIEEERSSRLHDRQGQQLSMKNARKVSGLIARHNLLSSGSRSFFKNLEETERSRRLLDEDTESAARDNAKKVSSLVSALNVAPGTTSRQTAAHVVAPIESLPTESLPTESLPTYHAPIETPTTVSIPTTPVQPLAATVQQQQAPIQQASVRSIAAPVAIYAPEAVSASVMSAPVMSAPVMSAPVMSAPIMSAPIMSAPIMSAPIMSAPIMSAPVMSAPMYAPAPIASAPIPLTGSVQPIVLPTTAVHVPVAPLATTSVMPLGTTYSAPVVNTYTEPMYSAAPGTYSTVPTTAPTTYIPFAQQPAVVPSDPYLTQHRSLGEREKRKLQKQVEKNNKKSERDIRKAEHTMLKAEKMHQKGRDDKALKLENKADRFMQNADYKRKYASGLQTEVRNAPAPASM